jgi:transcriptional regulator with XRE-family HTH domain
VKRTRQSEIKNVVGARVRKARLSSNPSVSQDDLSGKLARLGVQITQTGISKIENGERYLMDYEIVAIAKALKVTVAWLFGEE